MEKLLFSLLRNEIIGDRLPDDFNLSQKDAVLLFKISKKHDLAHLVGDALMRNKLLFGDELKDAFKKQIHLSVLRVEHQNAEYKRICNLFETAKIRFMPLKGVLIRRLYPEPWMRTSCDIDILIRKEEIEKAKGVLVKNGFVTDSKKNFHDMHFYSGDIHLELHFNICENNKQIDGLLSFVWDYSERVTEYEYCETSEFFIFHHLAHMFYHFLNGGCGIRSFIDLWILNHKTVFDKNKVKDFLVRSRLIKFAEACEKLSGIWLEGNEHDGTTKILQDYILDGGVYGSFQNKAIMFAKTKKNIWLSLWKPYSELKKIYPNLAKYKFLLPFYEIRRWGDIIVKFPLRRRIETKKVLNKAEREQLDGIDKLIADFELKQN